MRVSCSAPHQVRGGGRLVCLILLAAHDPDVAEQRQREGRKLRAASAERERGAAFYPRFFLPPSLSLRPWRVTEAVKQAGGATCRGWYSFIRKRSTSLDLPTAESPSRMIFITFSCSMDGNLVREAHRDAGHCSLRL